MLTGQQRLMIDSHNYKSIIIQLQSHLHQLDRIQLHTCTLIILHTVLPKCNVTLARTHAIRRDLKSS